MANGREDGLFCSPDGPAVAPAAPTRAAPAQASPAHVPAPRTSPVETALDDAATDMVPEPVPADVFVGPPPGSGGPARAPVPAPAEVPAPDEPLLIEFPEPARRTEPAPTRAPTPEPHPRDRERSLEHFGVAQMGDNGPYIYGGVGDEMDGNGACFGMGLGHHHDANSDADYGVHVGIGHHEDLDGNQYDGLFRVHGGITLGASDDEMPGPGDPLYAGAVEGSAVSVDAGIYDDGETFTAGAQANLGEVSAEYGTDPSRNSQSDTSGRFGLSAGGGAALRLHHGDEDGDGITEAGFGVDAGMVSFDVRSELLTRAWQWANE